MQVPISICVVLIMYNSAHNIIDHCVGFYMCEGRVVYRTETTGRNLKPPFVMLLIL